MSAVDSALKTTRLKQLTCLECDRKFFKTGQNQKYCAKCKITGSSWQKRNPEKAKRWRKEYMSRPENILRHRETSKRWQQEHSEERKKYNEEWRKKNPEARVWWWTKKKYNLDKRGYTDLWNRQNGVCPICHKKLPAIRRLVAVDHCHTTGENRGLLHLNCNSHILGVFEKNFQYLQNAFDYLKLPYKIDKLPVSRG